MTDRQQSSNDLHVHLWMLESLGLRSLQEQESNQTTIATADNVNIDANANANANETGWDFNETEIGMNYSNSPSMIPSDSPSDVPSFAPSRSLMPSVQPSTAPSSTPTTFEQKFINSNDAQIIAQTFRLYGSLYLGFFVSFCYLRRKFPVLYNIRSWVPEIKTDLATNQEYGFFSWCWQVFKISDDDLLDTCGMDALCFLRALRLGAKLAFMCSINAMWLIPLYLTSEESPETEYLTDPFVLMSMANVPNNSTRFIGTILAAYIIMLSSMYMISREYDWFTEYRHKYLSQKKARNYTVYVSGIPESIQSSFALADHFRQSTSWSHAVFEADVAMDIPTLEAKVAKRDKLVETIEHIRALERKKGVTKRHHSMKIKQILKGEGVKKVDSVSTYMAELDHLNSQISLQIGQVRGSNHRMRQHLKKSHVTSRHLSMDDDIMSPSEGFSPSDRRAGVRTSISAPTLVTHPYSNSSMRGLGIDQDDERFSAIMEYCVDIEGGNPMSPIASEGDPMSPSASEGNLNIEALQPSSSDESRRNSVAVTEPSTDESKFTSQYNTQLSDISAERENPHPFLTMFGLDTSVFNRSTIDLNEIRDPEDTLNSLSVDSPDKVYEDKVDESVRVGFDLDQDFPDSSNVPLYGHGMEPMGLDFDTSYYGDLPKDIGQGDFDTSMLIGTSGMLPEIPEHSSDGSQINSRGSLSRGSSGSRSSNWNVESIRDSMKSGAKRVTSGTVNLGSKVKKVSSVGASKVRAAKKKGVSGVKKAAELGIQTIQQAPDLGAHLASSAAAMVPLRLGRTDGKPRDAGFVVFRDLYTTQAARQMLQHHKASCMLVEPAPDPEEVFWPNVGLPEKARRSGWLLSLVATSVLCFFWSIPMAFFSSLTEVNSLKENVPVLAEWLEECPGLETFLALIAPLLVLTLNEAFLPVILKFFAQWEGHVGASLLEASLFVKLCAFVFIQTFFVSAVSGTITAELGNFLENPEMLVDLLANSLPAQSSYFIQICLVFTFLFQGADLIRAYPLGLALMRRYFVGPRLTAKERRKTWKMVHSLEDPPEFWHAELSAQVMLFFVVVFVYAVIAPITSVFLLLCFLICESGYRYHFVHSQKPYPDSGGKLWQGMINVLMASMIIGQCTLFGLLILKKTVYALPTLAPLGVITVLYMIFTVPKRNHVATFLPTLKCVAIDKKNEEEGITVSQFAAKEYLQPALKAQPMWPEGMEIPRPRARTMSRDGTK